MVSIIGDSTFIHTGVNGLVEMVYNPPATGHVLIVLDNGTTAMTGQQEHPGTGRTLDHEPTGKVSIEGIARALGVDERGRRSTRWRTRPGSRRLLARRLAAARALGHRGAPALHPRGGRHPQVREGRRRRSAPRSARAARRPRNV